MIRIKAIMPVSTDNINEPTMSDLKKLNLPDVEFDVVNLKNGPPLFIDGRLDEATISPELIEMAQDAEKNGFHGIYISCFYDPAVEAIREVVKIPVFGAMAPSLATAQLISQKYAIVTVVEKAKTIFMSIIRSLNLESNVSGIYVTDIAFNDLFNHEVLLTALENSCLQAINDGAQAIVLGCTGMIGLTESLYKILKARNIFIPLIDGTTAPIMQLYALCKQSLSHSPLNYPEQKGELTKGLMEYQ